MSGNETLTSLTYETQTNQMTEYNSNLYQKIISDAAGKIAAHKEFKEAYDQELAFDFDLFRFFTVGENKISEILAFFLKPDGRHGQGDLFLKDFTERLEQKLQEPIYLKSKDREPVNIDSSTIEKYRNAVQNISRTKIQTEQPLDRQPDRNGRRRIDIYIPLRRYAIAIENKVWAKDQSDQMKDYKDFLNKRHKGGNLLVYLTPYGHKPDGISITQPEWESGLKNGSICSMSYKHHILPMLESWESKCKAERVRFFIREFKNHLHVKFLGGNHLTMTESLEPIIRNNAGAAKELSKAYAKIEEKVQAKISYVALNFAEPGGKPLSTFAYPPGNPTNFVVKKGLKASNPAENIDHPSIDDLVYVHLSEHYLELKLTFYADNKSNLAVLEKVRTDWENAEKNGWEEKRIPQHDQVETTLVLNSQIPKSDLLKLFSDKVKLVATALGQQYQEKPLAEN